MTLDLSQCDDQELASLAVAGQGQAFRELMRRYRDPLYRLIRNNVGDPEEATDLLQESFVSAFAAIHRYDAERPFRFWLSRIALNKCRDWARRRAVRRAAVGSGGARRAGGACVRVVHGQRSVGKGEIMPAPTWMGPGQMPPSSACHSAAGSTGLCRRGKPRSEASCMRCGEVSPVRM